MSEQLSSVRGLTFLRGTNATWVYFTSLPAIGRINNSTGANPSAWNAIYSLNPFCIISGFISWSKQWLRYIFHDGSSFLFLYTLYHPVHLPNDINQRQKSKSRYQRLLINVIKPTESPIDIKSTRYRTLSWKGQLINHIRGSMSR